MRRIAMMVIVVMGWAAVAAQVLPGDGEGLTVYGLDAAIGECDGGLCDLSQAAIIGQTEMRFEYYGDTLVRCVAGPRADWLRISNDTIWSVGADTRRDNIRYSHGLPYLLPCGSAGMADSLRHNIFLTINQENAVSCRYSSGRGAGFILPGGDTIPSTYLILTEVSDTTGIVRHSRWYAQGAVWPVVEQVTVSTGHEEYSAVNICPPDGQPRPKTFAKGSDGRNAPHGIYGLLAQLHGTDPAPGPGLPPGSGGYDITVTPQGITVRGEDTDRATVRLYDTAGRLWHEGDASAPISTSQLTAGVYLLHITSDTHTHTAKLTITGH